MQLKKIMIPLAAFAITVTGASAFTGNDWLNNANLNLTDTEVSALEEAQEIRETARAEAEQVLKDAGIDEAKMKEIHDARHEAQKAQHESVKAAIAASDYSAFTEAVKDSPFADKISSEADFQKLVAAHELKESGDIEGAREIMEELGLKGFGGRMGGHGR